MQKFERCVIVSPISSQFHGGSVGRPNRVFLWLVNVQIGLVEPWMDLRSRALGESASPALRYFQVDNSVDAWCTRITLTSYKSRSVMIWFLPPPLILIKWASSKAALTTCTCLVLVGVRQVEREHYERNISYTARQDSLKLAASSVLVSLPADFFSPADLWLYPVTPLAIIYL